MPSLLYNEKFDKQSWASWLMTFPNSRMSINSEGTSL